MAEMSAFHFNMSTRILCLGNLTVYVPIGLDPRDDQDTIMWCMDKLAGQLLNELRRLKNDNEILVSNCQVAEEELRDTIAELRETAAERDTLFAEAQR